MDKITPPPMPDEQIDATANDAFEAYMRDQNDDFDRAFARSVEAARDRQWLAILKEAVLAEREACAKVCEQSDEEGEGPDCWGWHAKDFAAAIRSRSNT